jgi:hypothetical protein
MQDQGQKEAWPRAPPELDTDTTSVGRRARTTAGGSTAVQNWDLGGGSVSECATIQELSDFALPYGVTQGLYWPVPIFREGNIRELSHCGSN